MENKFDKELNYDVASEEKISKTNEELVKYMESVGENVAAEQIQYLIDQNQPKQTKKPVKNPIDKKLLAINTQILDVLKRIQEDMFDEQDTSIKKVSAIQTATKSKIDFPKQDLGTGKEDKEDSGGFLDSLLGGLGVGATALGATALSKLKNALGLTKTTPTVDKPNAPDKTMAQQEADAKKAEAEKQKAEKAKADAKKKAEAEKQRKAQEAKQKAEADRKAKAEAERKKTQPKQTKTEQPKTQPKAKPAETKSTKPSSTKASAPKPDVKAPNAPKVDAKVAKPSKLAKIKPTGILKKLTRFSKAVPVIGTAIAAASAIYSAVDGYKSAGEILEIPDSDLTETEKLASAAGAVVNDFSFGLVSAKSTAETIVGFLQDKEKDRIIEKYDNKLGVIDYSTLWKSDVTNWHAIENGMSSNDIGEIISLDDWSDDDLKRLTEAKKAAEQYEKFKAGKDEEDLDEAVAYAMQAYRLSQGSLTGQDDMIGQVESSPEIEQKIQDFKTQAEKLSNGVPFAKLVEMGIAQDKADAEMDPFEEDSDNSPAETRDGITDAQKKDMAISSYKFAQSTGNPQYLAAAQKKLDELGIDVADIDKETTAVEKSTQPGVSSDAKVQPKQEAPTQEQNNQPITQAEPMTQKREVAVQQFSENLRNSTKAYDSNQIKQIAQVLMVKNNINNNNIRTDKPIEQRLLNMFT